MKKVNVFFPILGLIILTSILSGCMEDININKYIDKNIPLKLTIFKKNDSTGLTTTNNFEIAINSDKYKKIIEWGNQNTTEWQSTPASYIADIYVGQSNFRLLYILGNDGVLIGFTDEDGKPKQYTKTIKKGDLDFLNK